ncbi:MAG: RNA polymerase factor sigma-54 [Dysgonamonadaceae bacterium]|jgi:RNA polymerase sigma-54 factor|nr:RNA polymerase factor sigma-54 [Dysgonamonadaceae bacterium]
MIRQQLAQKQQQKLSPTQIQQIKMLGLNSLEIENLIIQELEENPVLEEISDTSSETDRDEYEYDNSEDKDNNMDDFSLGDYLTEDDVPDYALNQHYKTDEKRGEIPYSELESFREYLINQLQLKYLSEEKRRMGEYIIGNIDDNGYLRRTPEALSDDLAFQYDINASVAEVREMIALIQQFDPPGIGANDVRECLLLQLQRKEKTPVREWAIILLENYFDAFSQQRYATILRELNGLSEKNLRSVIKEITLLNPKPGNAWGNNMETKMSHVTPDFIVEADNGELFFYLPEENIPELHVRREYNDLLKDYVHSTNKESASKKDTITFVKQKIDSAKWFIEAIKQRHKTLRKTMAAILEIQRNFFLTGDESCLKPMKLRDVSALCGYDISTISRVSTSKYVQTNWGVYPLRFFFSDGITSDDGENISIREIKAMLRSFIEQEDRNKPLTDDALVGKFREKGYTIARRTVAKYREQMNIQIARFRKEMI